MELKQRFGLDNLRTYLVFPKGTTVHIPISYPLEKVWYGALMVTALHGTLTLPLRATQSTREADVCA